VREWHDEEGWGVIDFAAAPGGCWAHFSVIEMDGYRALAAGGEVEVDVEVADQDGYVYRAVAVRLPGRTGRSIPNRDRKEADAFDARLEMTFEPGAG
jgi:CspA family cold shock protein